MYIIHDLLGIDDMDAVVLWVIVTGILFVTFIPFSKMIMFLVDLLTEWLGELLYVAIQPIMRKFKVSRKKKPKKNITYNIQREERHYPIRDSQGNFNYPFSNPEIRERWKLNNNYPGFNTTAYKKAQQLDMDYFTSKNYPHDYIMIGHRMAIEEARKGSRLTEKEESYIKLGYGYDGLPFGEPWGIEEECLSGYTYALEEGDFLDWLRNEDKYQAYIAAGYEPPKDYHRQVNRDTLEHAERKMETYGLDTKRLTKATFARLKNNPEFRESNIQKIPNKA